MTAIFGGAEYEDDVGGPSLVDVALTVNLDGETAINTARAMAATRAAMRIPRFIVAVVESLRGDCDTIL